MFSKVSKGLIVGLLLASTVFGDDVKYVQSVKADVHKDPNQSAPKVATLKRGDTVTVTETKDLWVKVKAGNVTGWMSKIFLSSTKPVGQADLQKEVPQSLEKASRRRPPSYSVNAAARGLAEDETTKGETDGYKADFKTLKKVEERKVPADEVNKFRDNANLPK